MAGKARKARADFIAGEADGAVRFRVHVRPGAGADRVLAPDPWRGAAVVQVRAQAEGGKANARLLEFLAEALGVRQAQLEIEHGRTSREKVVLVRGLDADAVRSALGGSA